MVNWSGDICIMCEGSGKDFDYVTRKEGIIATVVGLVERDRPCRACNGHGRNPS